MKIHHISSFRETRSEFGTPARHAAQVICFDWGWWTEKHIKDGIVSVVAFPCFGCLEFFHLTLRPSHWLKIFQGAQICFLRWKHLFEQTFQTFEAYNAICTDVVIWRGVCVKALLGAAARALFLVLELDASFLFLG